MLRHEPDVGVADWIVRDGLDPTLRAPHDEEGRTRVGQGPPGFEAWATVWFDDGEDDETYRADDQVMSLLVALAAEHTTTPDRAWFALWEGWGELDGGHVYESAHPLDDFGRIFRPRRTRTSSAFGPDVMKAPRAHLGDWRSYVLFTGTLADVGAWGARPLAPDWPRAMPPASFTWPEDRAWCITADVDPVWVCVGGSQALIDAVLARPDLVSAPATYGDPPPDEEWPAR